MPIDPGELPDDELEVQPHDSAELAAAKVAEKTARDAAIPEPKPAAGRKGSAAVDPTES